MKAWITKYALTQGDRMKRYERVYNTEARE
jgi:hypothetical protein